MAAGQSRAVAAEPRRDRRGQPVRAAAVLRPADPRHRPAAGVRRRLPGPAIRHRGDAPPLRGRGPAADRHHRQAERRASARGDGRSGRRRCARAGSTSSRTTNCRPTAPHCPFEARARAVMRAIDRHADRTGKKVDVRLQRHRRTRRDAPASRSRCGARRHLRHGEPQLGRPRRHDRARPARAAADPRPPQRLGLPVPPPAARLVLRPGQKLWRLAGADHMHVNGLRNKFCEPDDSVIASAHEPA